MPLSSTFQPLLHLIDRYRPAFFSKEEWWFHLSMIVVLLPIGNYLNFGPTYLTNRQVFLLGTLCGSCLYLFSIVLLTWLIRRIIARYPSYQQTVRRTLVMTLLVNGTALLYNLIELYICSQIPLFHSSFDWETIRPMWLVSLGFVTALCLVVNLLHAYTHWKKEQMAVEQLKHETLQRQFDALKQQVNPHFLFNSLSSISAMVSEDSTKAERFVDDLAKVYRYMLQAGNRDLVPLTQELNFIQTYTQLLGVRYGNRLHISLCPTPAELPGQLPPLSLQTLIDNALKHNSMSDAQPLRIQVSADEATVSVVNSRQRKTRLLKTNQRTLQNLVTQYQQLTTMPVRIDETDDTFSVTLPLLQLTEKAARL